MILNFLPFISLTSGKNSFKITGETTFTAGSYIAVFPYQTEGFTFRDSNNKEITEFPTTFQKDNSFTVTPSEDQTNTNLNLAVAPLFTDCPSVRYVLTGIFNSDDRSGYYNTAICYAFFPLLDSDFDLKFDNVWYSEGTLSYITDKSTTPTSVVSNIDVNCSTITIKIKDVNQNGKIDISALNIKLYQIGDFEKPVTGEIVIHVPPNAVFVGKDIERFQYESDATLVDTGIFYNKTNIFVVKARCEQPSTLLYSVTLINPHIDCSNLNVEVVKEDASTIFADADYDYNVDNFSTICHIFTSPHVMKYKMISYSFNKIYDISGKTFNFNIYDTAYSYINRTIFLYSGEKPDRGVKFGLESAEIIEPASSMTHDKETKAFHVYGDIQRNAKPATRYYYNGNDQINYPDGTY